MSTIHLGGKRTDYAEAARRYMSRRTSELRGSRLAQGGLAATPTGIAPRQRLFG
jgi:hypothetical protein